MLTPVNPADEHAQMIAAPDWSQSLRWITRVLLVAICLVPLLWVWPQRGATMAFYTNPRWSNDPLLVRVERKINLDFMAADSTSFPQQNFSIEWSGWLRTDRDGEYTFYTTSDDGSTLEIDGHLVVDNGGVHGAVLRAGTLTTTRGLHQIRVRFLQVAEGYEFRAAWTPPGEKNPSALPTQQLFVHQSPAVVVFLTRHIVGLWASCWFALALLIAVRTARRARGMDPAELRQRSLRLTLAFGASLMALLVAEGALRIAHYVRDDRRPLEVQLRTLRAEATASMHDLDLGDIVQPSRDPGIVYELRPNVRGRFVNQPLLINSQGLHDYEYTRHKEPGTFRIVGVGDSSLFGWGVPFEDSSLKVLERRLNAESHGRKFEVINFAVPGYNTAMEAETFLATCLEYQPDLVLLNFNTNDYDVPNFMRRPGDLATLRRSYLFDLVYSVYDGVMGLERYPPPFDFNNRTTALRQAEHLDEDPALPDEYRYMVGAKGVVRALERLAAAAHQRNIPFIVYTVKEYPGLDPKYQRDEWRDRQRELLERESRRLGYLFLNNYPDYTTYLKQHPEANLKTVFAVSEIDGHPNTVAHAIDAQSIFDFLVAHQLLPLDKPSNSGH
jgi:hypothetical protein